MDQASSSLDSKIEQIVEYSPKKLDGESREKIKSKHERLICTESQNEFFKYEGGVVIFLLACVNLFELSSNFIYICIIRFR